MEQFLSLVFFCTFGVVFSAGAGYSIECPPRHFRLPGMEECHNWLTCSDLKNVKVGKRIGVGSTKVVHLGSWNGLNVALSQLLNDNFTADFDYGLEMLEEFSHSQYVVQLVGFCKRAHLIVTEYHQFGNATSILSVLNKMYGSENVVIRLKLCLNYARILDLLHNGPAGTRVMCDSNDLDKLLSQMLITDDLTLILNDLDALPLVEKSAGVKIKCGNREIFGDFVPPEQKWPFNGVFKAVAMPGYDEKTDIWKAADVFRHLISDIDMSHDWVQYRLFNLFKACKNSDPHLRPSARYIVSVLEKILAELFLKKTEL